MENSKIEWCDHTFNPWIGCTKVSPGCANCYAEMLMDKRFGQVEWGPTGIRKRTSKANWRKPLTWNGKAKREGRRYRVFCASLADVFEDRPELDGWRTDFLWMAEDTPNLNWLLLTKRPENVTRMMPRRLRWFAGWPDNIWIGASIENQEQADKRIPELRRIPARVRFLNVEPLLGPVDLDEWLMPNESHPSHGILAGDSLLDWVIVGGESGPNARPMQSDWVRSIRDQCQEADIPFFFKQGSSNNWSDYKNFDLFPSDLKIREHPNGV